MQVTDRNKLIAAILVGGAAAAALDAVDAIIAFKVVLGFDPIPIYQFVASGLLGPSAFSGGAATALVGLGVHLLVAFTAASTFVWASALFPVLRRSFVTAGAAFGVGVYVVMSYVVTPLSRIPPAPFSLPLFLNGIIGHVLLVGLPIAYAARRWLGAESRTPVAWEGAHARAR